MVAAIAALPGCGSKSTSDGDRLDVGRDELEAIDVGTRKVDPTTGPGLTIDFEVDDSVLSTTVVAAPAAAGVTVFATELFGPGGEELMRLDLSSVDTILPSLYEAKVRAYPFLGPGPFALTYPGSPANGSGAGTYRARYNVFGGTAQDVRFFTVQKRLPKGGAAPTAGKLPITVWFAENEDVNAATAADTNDERADAFRQALAEFQRVYAGAGIDAGAVAFRDLPTEAARRFAVVERDEFSELFASVDASETPGLNFFVVESLELDSQGGVVVGLANGIPGPPALPGLPGGGVVVSLVALEYEPKLVGQVMAHEGGHYLGLMHTTERTGTLFDLLDDTPQCTASTYDADGDDSVDVRECGAEGGANNLMFWSAEPANAQITPDQRFVLLRNPMVDTSGAP